MLQPEPLSAALFCPPACRSWAPTLTGAAVGSQVGALAGSVIDQALLGASGQSRTVQGPRLSELRVTASYEGAAIGRSGPAYARTR